ncbi:NADH:flavin oxidoreductase [Sporolactobacillus pectinivorans]|uniref:NADH:flavin oxidoreductase n=1 Tax=Sporolactobacillus pectinivorans TaxID=1591408 RepID=UPI000C25A22E|nr:NADH:flavin oxidoreductase [Sporolactobacillus pectinivorans]
MDQNKLEQRLLYTLFQPLSLGKLNLSNRIVMAPMTRGFSPDGVPGQSVADYYRRRAENDVGLIVTEGTLINHPSAGSNANWPHFYGPDALKGWANVANAVHDAGGKIIPQLWHVGMARQVGDFPNPEARPIGPSGLSLTGTQVNAPMTESEISAIVEAYGQAAADAKRLGFDGIEIHGAHGYLIDQFFWARTNKRTDRYGGNIAARGRFAAEIVAACRAAVGPEFPIVFRFSQWKTSNYSAKLAQTADELEQFLTPLVNAGVDIFHCSTRRFWELEFDNSTLNLAGWTKKLSGKSTITVGSVGLHNEFSNYFSDRKGAGVDITNIEGLIERVEKNEFDLVAVGRALLADPAWARKIREGKINELISFHSETTKHLF